MTMILEPFILVSTLDSFSVKSCMFIYSKVLIQSCSLQINKTDVITTTDDMDSYILKVPAANYQS